MRGGRAELRHVAEEGVCVGELSGSAAHVVLLEEQLDEARVLFRGGIDVLRVQERRGEASMSHEVLWVDRHRRPQQSARRDPVLLARQHGGASTERVDLYLRRHLSRVCLLDVICYRHHTTPLRCRLTKATV